MKKMLEYLIPLLLAAAVVITGGNIAMRQMTALVGQDYAQVFDVGLAGDVSYVEFAGQRLYLEETAVQNVIYQIKSTIQSAAHGVKYGIDRR